MTWQPPSPLPRHTIKIALAIGLGLAVLSYTFLGVVIATHPPTPYTYPPYVAPSSSPAPTSGSGPVVTGDPASPEAVQPVACPSECFSAASVQRLFLTETTLVGHGFDYNPDIRWGLDPTTTAADAHNTFEAPRWIASRESPDDCFSASTRSPDPEWPTTTSMNQDMLGEVLVSTGPNGLGLDQWVRIFPDTASATVYMHDVYGAIVACPHLDSGKTITAEARLPDLDLSVAAIGSAQEQNGLRSYVMDLQRGNLVIRTTVEGTDAFSDADFREIINTQAHLLANVTPH